MRLWTRDAKGRLWNVGQLHGVDVPLGPGDYGDGLVRVGLTLPLPELESSFDLRTRANDVTGYVLSLSREPLRTRGFHNDFRSGTLLVIQGEPDERVWTCEGMTRYRVPFSFEEIHHG